MVQDLTEDHEGEESTGCACTVICDASCACHRAHGICDRSCSCKGEGCCELRVKVTKHLFGGQSGIKLTSCFEQEISKWPSAHGYLSQNPVGLSMIFPANKMDPPVNPRGCIWIRGPCPTTEEEFVRNVAELVDSLVSKVLEVRNGSVPCFPSKMTSGPRGCTALVSWYNKWLLTSGSPTPLNEQLIQELFRYALTDDPGHDCYYSFCTGQWESKSTRRHCEGCGRCVKSQYTHCAICQTCFLGSLAGHQSFSGCHAPGSD